VHLLSHIQLPVLESCRNMEPPTFGAPSFPHSTTSPQGLGSMAEGFTNWASQPSPYRTIAPWTSYRERNSNNTTTTTSHELSPASAPRKTISFPLTPFGPSVSNIPGPRPSRADQLPMFESLEDERPIKAEQNQGNRTLADSIAHVQPVARAGNTRAKASSTIFSYLLASIGFAIRSSYSFQD
jgi:hypothetical protein